MSEIRFTTSAERVAAMLAHDESVTREPFPAPVYSSRELTDIARVTPEPAHALAGFAIKHGWDVRVQYALGRFPHATTGRPGALKDSIALRFGGHAETERQAFAVYVRAHAPAGTWSWQSIMIWGPDLPPYAGCGLARLKDFLMDAPGAEAASLLAWVQMLKAEVAARAVLAEAERARKGPAARPVREGMR